MVVPCTSRASPALGSSPPSAPGVLKAGGAQIGVPTGVTLRTAPFSPRKLASPTSTFSPHCRAQGRVWLLLTFLTGGAGLGPWARQVGWGVGWPAHAPVQNWGGKEEPAKRSVERSVGAQAAQPPLSGSGPSCTWHCLHDKAPALLILSVPSTAASSHRAQVGARPRPLAEKR